MLQTLKSERQLRNRLYDLSLPRIARSMSDFAQEEIIIPDGQFEGTRFKFERQPYTRLFLEEVDSGKWTRFAVVGPSQSGKTMLGFVIPMLFHLFEMNETVVCGVTDMDMAADKWRENILPVIECSQFRDLLPQSGTGSKGGKIDTIQFRNGATLKFMTARGSDKSRAHFRTRILVATEIDGYDTLSKRSIESDKLSQMEARTRMYSNEMKRIYLECTTTIEEGLIWQEYLNGTQSIIRVICPFCNEQISPGRENLMGWQDAQNIIEAREKTKFHCPKCNQPFSEIQRREMNEKAFLYHQNGNPTFALSFRWSAFNNLFIPSGDIGIDEWKATKAHDEENKEREMCQFVWALPYIPDKTDVSSLDYHSIIRKSGGCPRGIVPAGHDNIVVAVDLRKRFAHWMAVAWDKNYNGQIIDYGKFDLASDYVGVEKATLLGLRDFKDITLKNGWIMEGGAAEKPKMAKQVWIDSGYAETQDIVYQFCKEAGLEMFRPIKGHQAGLDVDSWYSKPRGTGSVVKLIGLEYHLALQKAVGIMLVEINSDFWKSFAHERLAAEQGKGAALVVFASPNPNEHISLAKQLTAEKKYEEYIPGKGMITKWARERRDNHWLDTLYICCAAGHFCGSTIIIQEPKPGEVAPVVKKEARKMPDGRPYFILNRGRR